MIRSLSVIIIIDIVMIRSVIINTAGGPDKATSHIVLVSFVHCRLKKNARSLACFLQCKCFDSTKAASCNQKGLILSLQIHLTLLYFPP